MPADFGVDSYPELYYVAAAKDAPPVRYDGEHTAAAIVEWMTARASRPQADTGAQADAQPHPQAADEKTEL